MQNTLSALLPQKWTVPLPMEYGPGARHELAALCNQFGISRPFIITDQGSLNLPFVAELQHALNAAGLACGHRSSSTLSRLNIALPPPS